MLIVADETVEEIDTEKTSEKKSKDTIKVPTALDYCTGSLGVVGGTVANASDMVTRSTVRLFIDMRGISSMIFASDRRLQKA